MSKLLSLSLSVNGSVNSLNVDCQIDVGDGKGLADEEIIGFEYLVKYSEFEGKLIVRCLSLVRVYGIVAPHGKHQGEEVGLYLKAGEVKPLIDLCSEEIRGANKRGASRDIAQDGVAFRQIAFWRLQDWHLPEGVFGEEFGSL